MILFRVRQLRKRFRYEGVRKLQILLRNPAYGIPIHIGRDHLLSLLKRHNLLSELRKRYKHTSNNEHQYPIYPNLLKDLTVTHINQAWVCDITYLRLMEGKFCYLFLVTELLSRKIIGYSLSTTLSADGAIEAFKMAVKTSKPEAGFIHHSDHGIQYCCKKYRNLIAQYGGRISMTGNNHCYDNAVAERINGILKQEYGLGSVLRSFTTAKLLTDNGILIYNTERLHQSLQYQTPDIVYTSLNTRAYANASALF